MSTENGEAPLKVVYFGTPEYAVPALDVLAADPSVDVSLVVTQPDRPAGRGRKLTQPPVKLQALEYGLDVYQPQSLRTAIERDPVAEKAADLFVVAAYGSIFGPRMLALPRFGSINLHASLLPAYRGASPISAAILEGDEVTGVTLMRMDQGMDTGIILASIGLEIFPTDTTESLTRRLSILGAELLAQQLPFVKSTSLIGTPQNPQDASITRPLIKSDGWIDWSHSAEKIERFVRAMWSWPRAWTTLNGDLVQIHAATVSPNCSDGVPGTVLASGDGVIVTTGDGCLQIDIAQSAGNKALTGPDWAARNEAAGAILGASGAPLKTADLPLIRPVES